MTKLIIIASVGFVAFALKFLLLNKKGNLKFEKNIELSEINLIAFSIKNEKFLFFSYLNETFMVKPIEIVNDTLKAYCYIKNIEREFKIIEIYDIEIKENAYSFEYSYYDNGIFNIKDILDKACDMNQIVCIKYQRPSKPDLQINPLTGKRYFNGLNRGEISIRTISNLKRSINNYDDYIVAYCHTKNEERTFKVKRIKKVSILNM